MHRSNQVILTVWPDVVRFELRILQRDENLCNIDIEEVTSSDFLYVI